MNIKLDKIKHPWYDPREDVDDKYIEELAESIKKDGLLNPILVKSSEDGMYEVIAGGHRLRAVKKLEWTEIEAKLIDIEESEASILAIKTNILQKNLTDIEEGKAIKRIIEKFSYTQSEIADKLGKSPSWVSNRLALILNVSQSVQNALKEEKISTSHAVLLSKLSKRDQDNFLKYIISKKLNINHARDALKKYENKTIYTIGYQGKDLDTFIEILKDNKIDLLIDIRESGKSTRKPVFNSEILKREFSKTNIEYIHKQKLGVIYESRVPYIKGYISHDCFKGWYEWHLDDIDFNIEEFVNFLKNNGTCCLMCMEEFSKPKKQQKYYCHRDFLVEKILNFKSEDPLYSFDERIDL